MFLNSCTLRKFLALNNKERLESVSLQTIFSNRGLDELTLPILCMVENRDNVIRETPKS